MPDIEKIKKGLEACGSDNWNLDKGCDTCPYYDFSPHHDYDFDFGCIKVLALDTLELLKELQEEIENLNQTAQSMMEGVCLLKEQDAVKIKVNKITDSGRCGRCPNCLIELNETDYPNYCGRCGQKVKWDG